MDARHRLAGLARTLIIAAAALAGAGRALCAQPAQTIAPQFVTSSAMALPGESFAMTLASTIQNTPLTIHDSTTPGSQTYTGSVVLTPTWVFVVNRTVSVYAYVSVQLTSGSSMIDPSLLQANATGGTGTANGSWNPFSTTHDGHPNAVLLSNVSANGVRRVAVGTAQQLTVGLRLSTTNTYIGAGLYTGVVTFAARVQ